MQERCPTCHRAYAKNRSIQQNRAYFGLTVTAIARQCNSKKDDMHKALAGEFLGYETVVMPTGKVRTVPRSTKTLTTKQFCDFMEKIQRYAAENGIDIPSPNEVPVTAYQ